MKVRQYLTSVGRKALFLSLFLNVVLCWSQQEIIKVSPTPKQGFVSFEEALQIVRKARINEQTPSGGFKILLEPGSYPVKKAHKFFYKHGGTKKAPLVVAARVPGKTIFFGGTALQPNWFSKLKDKRVSKRLIDKKASKYIWEVDLEAHNISDLGEITRHGWMLESPKRVSQASLTIEGKRWQLARWPNADEDNPYLEEKARSGDLKGMVSYTKIIDKGPSRDMKNREWYKDQNFMENGGTFEVAFDRFKHWKDIQNVWIDGVLGTTWEWTYNSIDRVDVEKKHITLKSGELNGLGGRLKRLSHFYFDNVLEELDREGEYFIDRKAKKMYVYSKKSLKGKELILSTSDDNLFDVLGSNHIVFDGLVFDSGRKNALYINKSHHITVKNCEVRNVSIGGIYIDGTNNKVLDSKIHHVGAYGVQVKGGNKKKLISANNLVKNCEIYSLGWDQKSQMPGIYFQGGVGNKAENNHLYDMPHFAIRMNMTSDCVVKNNLIHDLPTYHFHDGGAIYVYTHPLYPENRGNVLTNNYLYNVPTNGIYCDNYSMGVLMNRNYFQNVSYLSGEWGFGAIMLNTGGQNMINDNVFVDCTIPVLHGTGGFHQAYKRNPAIQKKWNATVEKYGNGKVEDTPYRKYNSFKTFLKLSPENNFKAFKFPSSVANRNLIFNPTVPLTEKANKPKGFQNKMNSVRVKANMYVESDPGFENLNKHNLNLKKEALKKLNQPKFKPGDFSSIGIQNQ